MGAKIGHTAHKYHINDSLRYYYYMAVEWIGWGEESEVIYFPQKSVCDL